MQTPSLNFLRKAWTLFLASVVVSDQGDLGDRKVVAMGKRQNGPIRLAIIYSRQRRQLLRTQRIWHKRLRRNTHPMVPGRKLWDCAETGSVAMLERSEGGKGTRDLPQRGDRIKTRWVQRGLR